MPDTPRWFELLHALALRRRSVASCFTGGECESGFVGAPNDEAVTIWATRLRRSQGFCHGAQETEASDHVTSQVLRSP